MVIGRDERARHQAPLAAAVKRPIDHPAVPAEPVNPVRSRPQPEVMRRLDTGDCRHAQPPRELFRYHVLSRRWFGAISGRTVIRQGSMR